jgi:3-oxoacyl-[acyl-carrier protein] reductase
MDHRMPSESLQSIRNTIDSAKVVCLFGVGALLKDCYHLLLLFLGTEPDVLCDNDRGKWGQEFFGKKCVSPAELANLDDVAVIVTVKNYENIYMQLNGMGLKNIFVCCFDRSYHTVHAVKRLGGNVAVPSGELSLAVPLEGKWTLITGAARGVGRLIALEMARLGSNIIAHGRSLSHVEEVVDACSALGVRAVPVAAELGNSAEVEEMLSHLENTISRVDIVFNNAAISPPCASDFWSTPNQDYLASFTVNTLAPIRICGRLIPAMIKRGFGRIINITSSIQNRPAEMAYACSKAALDKFVHDLAPSLRGTGVMITLVDPGWLRTDMGGPDAPCSTESVIPGALLGALLDGDINGRWFSAQDYAGLSIEAAIQKAKFISSPMSVRSIHSQTPSEGK